MATIIHAEIPAEEFALATTLATCAGATVECERLVESPTKTVMPLVWVRNTRAATIEPAFDQDDTVAGYTRLAGTETELLYEMDWHANIKLVLKILTTEGAVILDTEGTGDGWHLRVLFPDHNDIRAATDFCETHNLTLDIHSIRQLDEDDAHQGSIRAGLTTEQHEALTRAYQRGYFEVPRAVDLEALADEIGVSHQALSERLRRGHATLLKETLGNGADSATPCPAVRRWHGPQRRQGDATS